jgi:indolepyruvate ferredoxin oxidoreductase alpha subunit
MGERRLLSGNEAVALGALHAGCARGVGYPGTPSTEILQSYDAIGGVAEWAPNEKVAAEVALGVAFAGAWALTTMKHVGLNVAADVLFTAAYSGVQGALVFAVADDPGLASSQDEQDTRRYGIAAGVPVIEPADAQEAYDYTRLAFTISARWKIPVILRLTTRVSHTTSVVKAIDKVETPPVPHFVRDIPGRVMIPGHARIKHKELRAKLNEIREWCETEGPNTVFPGGKELGIVSAGVPSLHAREAAPEAAMLKLGMTYPLPFKLILAFLKGQKRTVVIEENDPYLVEQIRAAGGDVPWNPEAYRMGELTVDRVKRVLVGDTTPEAPPPKGKPPKLCTACPHGYVFEIFKKHDCIVAGDIGCYTLAALPPLSAMDSQICMGASIGVGLGLRHVLPENEARRVVSVIGDSTFMHSGLTGLAEMVYNPPPTGHVLVILDNLTTAMTGQQEHPGTGRKLDHTPTKRIMIEDVARAMGVPTVVVLDPVRQTKEFEAELLKALKDDGITVIIGRQPCLLAAGRIRALEQQQSGCGGAT